MEKLNKTKLIAAIIVVLVVVAVIALAVILVNKGKNGESSSKAGTISNTDSEFDALKVKDIQVKYDEATNQTILEFAIANTTEEKAENLTIQIQLLDENDKIIAGVETHVSTIDAKGEHKVNMTLGGNIQGIKKIKLANAAKETPAQ